MYEEAMPPAGNVNKRNKLLEFNAVPALLVKIDYHFIMSLPPADMVKFDKKVFFGNLPKIQKNVACKNFYSIVYIVWITLGSSL